MPVLKIKSGRAILIVENALFHLDVARFEIKECVDRGLARLFLLAGLGLVCRAVGVDDQMQLRPEDFQIAQQNARAPETQNADSRAQALGLEIRRLARGFKAMDDDSARFELQIEQPPVEGSNLRAPARGCLDILDQLPADHVFKTGRTRPKIETGNTKRQQSDG